MTNEYKTTRMNNMDTYKTAACEDGTRVINK